MTNPVDISKIKVGDAVDVRLVIAATGGRYLRVKSGETNFEVDDVDIIAHHPAPRSLKVGDRVYRAGSNASLSGEIKAVTDEVAWVLWDSCRNPRTEILSDLEPSDV